MTYSINDNNFRVTLRCNISGVFITYIVNDVSSKQAAVNASMVQYLDDNVEPDILTYTFCPLKVFSYMFSVIHVEEFHNEQEG